MARPMILIADDVLSIIHKEHTTGVPYSKLVKNHGLPMSAPTLAKLLGYYKAYTDASGDMKKLIYANLFPEWLSHIDTQPTNWIFRGVMPLGSWECNDITAVH